MGGQAQHLNPPKMTFERYPSPNSGMMMTLISCSTLCMGIRANSKVRGENLKLRPQRSIIVILGLEKQLKLQHSTSQGYRFLLCGAKGAIGIF